MEYREDSIIIDGLGYVEPKRVIFGKKRHWLKGDGHMGAVANRPGGQWVEDINQLVLEVQNKYCETMHCWIWNTLKGLCVLMFVKFGTKEDFSERFNGVLGGATTEGGSPWAGAESVRKDGVINQEALPWTSNLNTFWKFSSPRPMTAELRALGKKWLRKYKFTHDWVVYPTFMSRLRRIFGRDDNAILNYNIQQMVEALELSPLGCDVLAWQMRNGKAYKMSWQGSNHWTLIVGYVYGDHWIIYDSYTDCWRKAEWRYPFKWVMRYDIEKTNADQIDAEYIIDNFGTLNVKGDTDSGIYYIYDGVKKPYTSMEEYNAICDRYIGHRRYKVVNQDALNLIPEGSPMIKADIDKIKPFFSLEDSLKK